MTYPIGITCQEFVELVTDYLEGTLAAGDHVRFEQHLTVCPGCADYLDQMRQTINTAGRLGEESLDPTARDQLLELFRDWKRSE